LGLRQRKSLNITPTDILSEVGSMALAAVEYVLVPKDVMERYFASLGPRAIPKKYDSAAMLDEFERACRIDYRLCSSTIIEHMRHARRLLKFLGKHPLEATRQDLRHFLEVDRAQYAVKTIRVLYRRFFDSDLADCFKVPQSPLHIIIAPTREQLKETYGNLDDPELEAAFLLFASSGLRRHELIELTWEQIDMENRIIYPTRQFSMTKFQWCSCFNFEAQMALERLKMIKSSSPIVRVFSINKDVLTQKFGKASPPEIKITPQVLRDWFCCEMGRLNVPDRYIDAFCGRVPKSVLARNYTDYSPQRLKEIYDRTNLTILG